MVPGFCLAKVSELVFNENRGEATPVPLKLIVLGLLDASLLMTRLPLLAPVAVGVKVTVMVQVAAFTNVVPQVVARSKSPFATMLTMVRTDPPPVFVKVIVWAALDVP